MTTEPGQPPAPDAQARIAAREPKAIHRALRVLEAVAGLGPGTTAKAVSHVLNYPPATTYRLLNLLVQDGYLVRTPDLRGFALGQKVTALASFVESPRAPQAARQLVQELRSQLRAGVHLARYQHNRVSLIDMDDFFPTPGAEALTKHVTELLRGAPGAMSRSESQISLATTEPIRGIEPSSQFPSVLVPIVDDRGEVVACLVLVAVTRDIPPGERECAVLCEYASRMAPFLA